MTLTLVVEVIVAVVPWQLGGERGKEVVDGPGDDHVVVQTDEARSEKVGESQPLEEGCQVGVGGDWSQAGVLANGEFKQEAGDADEEQHEGVGDQKGAASVLEAEVGKPPNVAKTWNDTRRELSIQTCRKKSPSDNLERYAGLTVLTYCVAKT